MNAVVISETPVVRQTHMPWLIIFKSKVKVDWSLSFTDQIVLLPSVGNKTSVCFAWSGE